MAVTLSRSYQGYASGAVVAFDSGTESSLIAQGLAVAATGVPVQSSAYLMNSPLQLITQGGNVSLQSSGSGVAVPTAPQGPRILPNVPITAFASMGTSGVTVAGTLYRSEIFVPYLATWTGIGILNGATVGTDNGLVALYDSNGVLITNSAVAGAVAAGANAFQDRAFLNTVTLVPGRYFIAYQSNGTTATIRTQKAADGGNSMTASSTGTFGTIPASFTPPTTFTDVVGPIGRLYQ